MDDIADTVTLLHATIAELSALPSATRVAISINYGPGKIRILVSGGLEGLCAVASGRAIYLLYETEAALHYEAEPRNGEPFVFHSSDLKTPRSPQHPRLIVAGTSVAS